MRVVHLSSRLLAVLNLLTPAHSHTKSSFIAIMYNLRIKGISYWTFFASFNSLRSRLLFAASGPDSVSMT